MSDCSGVFIITYTDALKLSGNKRFSTYSKKEMLDNLHSLEPFDSSILEFIFVKNNQTYDWYGFKKIYNSLVLPASEFAGYLINNENKFGTDIINMFTQKVIENITKEFENFYKEKVLNNIS